MYVICNEYLRNAPTIIMCLVAPHSDKWTFVNSTLQATFILADLFLNSMRLTH